MKILANISRKWWFFLILLISQFIFLPFASRNFDPADTSGIIYTTLANAFQTQMGAYNIYFQILSALMLILLFVFRNKMKLVFNIYVAVSFIAFAFLQNMAVTEKYGFSIVTINLAMFLFVAYVWIREVFQQKNDYSFTNFKWKYSWMNDSCVLNNYDIKYSPDKCRYLSYYSNYRVYNRAL